MLAAVNNYNNEVVVELVRAGANVYEKNEVRKLLTYFHYNVIIIIIIKFSNINTTNKQYISQIITWHMTSFHFAYGNKSS